MVLAVILAASSTSAPTWLYLLVSSGIAVVVVPAATKQFTKLRDWRRTVKAAPIKKDAADIAQLRTDFNGLRSDFDGFKTEVEATVGGMSAFLLGTRHPILKTPNHDGFAETYPIFQEEVREGFRGIHERLDKLTGAEE